MDILWKENGTFKEEGLEQGESYGFRINTEMIKPEKTVKGAEL